MKTSLANKPERDLRRVGHIRGKMIHRNRISGKDHRLPDKVLEREWKSIEKKKQGAQTVLRKSLEKLFTRQIKLFLRRLQTELGIKYLNSFNESATKAEDFDLLVQTLLNWSKWFDRTRDTSQKGVIIVVNNGYKTGITRSGADPNDFTLPTETVGDIDPTTERVSQGRNRVANVINEILNQTANTQNTFRRTAARQIQRGLQEGDTMQGLVSRVADKTEEQIGYRLDRIVQTAGNGGFEVGEIQGMLDAGITRGSWLSQRDARVRTPENGDLWDHRSADGQESKLKSGWVIKGKGTRQETLRFPSDPLGSPGNTIYCRCSVRPIE